MKIPGFLFLAVMLLLSGSKLPAQHIAKPALEWKYGWADGLKSNTTGSARAGSALPAANPFLNTGYSPAQISHAYGFDQIPATGDGRGKVIAVVVAYGSPNLQKDLDTFCAQYSLPATTVNIVYPQGKPTTTDSGWAGETTLDVEWAHAMAPGASILLVVSPTVGMLTS